MLLCRLFVTSPRGLGVRSRPLTEMVKPATRGARSPKDACVAACPYLIYVPAGSHFDFYRRRHAPHLRGCLCRTFRDSLRLAALTPCSARWLPFVEEVRWRSEGMRAWSRVPGTNQSSERRSLLLLTTCGCWHCTCRQRSVESPRACTS